MISVQEALGRILAEAGGPPETEHVPLNLAFGRILAEPVAALRTQPPFTASAMDGYAARAADLSSVPARLRVVGTSVAGRRFSGSIGPGEAVRIFTGAPVPEGADAIVIQEDARAAGDAVEVLEAPPPGRFLRPEGLDFRQGDTLLSAGDRLDARRIALAAAMGHATLAVARRPRVALLATGDELVRPGEAAGPDQIVASNLEAVAGLVTAAGGVPIDLGIVADRLADVEQAVAEGAAEADLLVTLGGASVGDHDLVRPAIERQGGSLDFWRVALRPGKPLVSGRIGRTLVLGLPGNPVSSVVCGLLFLDPLVRALQGDREAASERRERAILGAPLPANDRREDYLRARVTGLRDLLPVVEAFERQDSSMLSVLAAAEVLIVRPPQAPAAKAGEPCAVLRLDR